VLVELVGHVKRKLVPSAGMVVSFLRLACLLSFWNIVD